MHPSSDRGFLLHVYHRQHGPGAAIFGIGRLESGETFAFVDPRQRPGFYLRASEVEAAIELCRHGGGQIAPAEATSLTTMDGEPVQHVGCRRVPQVRGLAETLHKAGLRTYEADLGYPRQYLIHRGLRGSVTIAGTWRKGQGVDRVYVEPDLAPSDWEPELRVLALDLETLPDASQILSCGFVNWGGDESVEEVHLLGDVHTNDPDHVYCHADERHLVAAIVERIRQMDPDVLTGWNVIDFDLTVLQQRCRALGVPFNLGRSTDDSWYQEGDTWGGSRVIVYGRQVLDAMHLVRSTLQRYDDYRLDTVARAVVGRGKTLEAGADGGSMPQKILDAWKNDRTVFCDYCLEDTRLVRDILQAEDLVQLSLRRGGLTGLPLERAWGSVAAFDFLYICGLRQREMVAPTTGIDRVKLGGSSGGLVMPTTAGLYRNIFVYDFKSLYPSIIRTFNIDPLTYLQARHQFDSQTRDGSDESAYSTERGELDQSDAADRLLPESDMTYIRAPGGARFVREPGILPQILEEFFAERAQARAQGDDLAAYTYKIVMNSFYGVLATGSCRFAEEELAGAITGFGHHLLRWAKEQLQSSGKGEVLYGDTDSLFVDHRLPADSTPAEAHAAAEELCRWINERVAVHVREQFDTDSHLEIEFEKYYQTFFLPPMRGDSERARAKGYAGLKVTAEGEEELEIIGMEAVRRDWTDVAHELQRDLLDLVFHDAPGELLEARVLKWVDVVRRGECDEQLIYRKALRKSVDSYTSNVPPHVAAARQQSSPRGTISYVVTRDGPQPANDRRAPIDYEHYIEKQIRPIVRTIGQVCDLDVEVALGGMGDLFRRRPASSDDAMPFEATGTETQQETR
ncbi:MAG: DNA polymerase II [Candidatus Latescibacteria bacterium]|nr:DNA polymerase II [Candidatus Latescibacterota bacterium]